MNTRISREIVRFVCRSSLNTLKLVEPYNLFSLCMLFLCPFFCVCLYVSIDDVFSLCSVCIVGVFLIFLFSFDLIVFPGKILSDRMNGAFTCLFHFFLFKARAVFSMFLLNFNRTFVNTLAYTFSKLCTANHFNYWPINFGL